MKEKLKSMSLFGLIVLLVGFVNLKTVPKEELEQNPSENLVYMRNLEK